jgi:hypothetical protein
MQHIERLSRRANIFGNLGLAKGGVTVNPSADSSSGGVCWGVGYKEAFAQGRDASDVREALAPLMPELGEDRRIVSDIVGHVRSSGQVYSPAQRSVACTGSSQRRVSMPDHRLRCAPLPFSQASHSVDYPRMSRRAASASASFWVPSEASVAPSTPHVS